MKTTVQDAPVPFWIFDIETTGLDPLKDTLVAVGFKTPGGPTEIIVQGPENDEGDVAQAAWELINKGLNGAPPAGKLLTGFNVGQFDLRWLYLKGWKYCPALVPKRTLPFVDLRDVLGQQPNYTGRGSLLDYCAFFGIKAKTEGNGLQVAEWFKAGQTEKIAAYLNEDLEATAALAKIALGF